MHIFVILCKLSEDTKKTETRDARACRLLLSLRQERVDKKSELRNSAETMEVRTLCKTASQSVDVKSIAGLKVYLLELHVVVSVLLYITFMSIVTVFLYSCL